LSQYLLGKKKEEKDKSEKESKKSGPMAKVLGGYERLLKLALDHRWVLAGLSLLVIAVSYWSYTQLGSDLLPPMDEGSFVIDYIMPAGSSLAETNRVVSHIVSIVQTIPEVETTARRTGLQLGLAAVTEANTGDISVQLKPSRSRTTDAIVADVRSQVAAAEPGIHIEFGQLLQDMIGDLTSAPQPVDIKLFSEDDALLRHWAPLVADKVGKISGVVDILNGIENTISGGSGDGCERNPRWRDGSDSSNRQQPRLYDPGAVSPTRSKLRGSYEQHTAGQRLGQHRHARISRPDCQSTRPDRDSAG